MEARRNVLARLPWWTFLVCDFYAKWDHREEWDRTTQVSIRGEGEAGGIYTERLSNRSFHFKFELCIYQNTFVACCDLRLSIVRTYGTVSRCMPTVPYYSSDLALTNLKCYSTSMSMTLLCGACPLRNPRRAR